MRPTEGTELDRQLQRRLGQPPGTTTAPQRGAPADKRPFAVGASTELSLCRAASVEEILRDVGIGRDPYPQLRAAIVHLHVVYLEQPEATAAICEIPSLGSSHQDEVLACNIRQRCGAEVVGRTLHLVE